MTTVSHSIHSPSESQSGANCAFGTLWHTLPLQNHPFGPLSVHLLVSCSFVNVIDFMPELLTKTVVPLSGSEEGAAGAVAFATWPRGRFLARRQTGLVFVATWSWLGLGLAFAWYIIRLQLDVNQVEEHDVAITGHGLGAAIGFGIGPGEVIALTSYDNDSNWMSGPADGHLGVWPGVKSLKSISFERKSSGCVKSDKPSNWILNKKSKEIIIDLFRKYYQAISSLSFHDSSSEMNFMIFIPWISHEHY